ncbi:MAG: anaerobic selenocysteine-containing dehydrogenase [Halieaceae bacterium]|jgi:anaerobic selenocysteine-containing dehydrogenase
MPTQTTELKRTYCKVCMVHCGLVAEVEGEQVVRVRGDHEHPLSRGYTCPKGRAIGKLHHSADAITQPLMRKNNELVPVSWDEALDDIAVKLRHIIDSHGPHAIGINFGSGLGLDSSGYAMEEALYRALGYGPKFSPLTIDGVAKVLVAGAVGGFPGINPKTDYENVELLLYVGTNPMVSHAHNTGMYNPAIWIKAVAERGEVWTIDPVFTETAKFSTRHVAAYPGKDYAILAWLTREIIDNGPLTPAQPISGLEDLRAALEGYDRATAADIAGVSEQEMEDLLAAIRRHGKVVIETGTGITMSAGCNMTQWFAWLLMILTGAMNRRGGTWCHPSFLTPFEGFEIPIMDPWTPGPTTRPDVVGVIGDWPCAVLPDEIEAGNIRGLMNFGGRLLRSFPDTNALTNALGKLELNVMAEINANETSALCTHVLPTKDGIERAEFTRWDTLAWNLSVQYSEPLVQPMGERRSAWWVIAEIMRRADLPVPDHVPLDDREQGADEAMLAHLMQTARCSFEELQEKRYIEQPMEFPAVWLDAHIERMGGWKLVPERLLTQWQEKRREDEAALGQPKPLCFTSRRQRNKFNAQLDFLGEEANILLHPDEAKLYNITDGQKVRVSTDTGAIELVARVEPGMRRGVTSIPHGHLDGNVNYLTSTSAIDEISGMALYSGVPIKLET